MANKKYSLIGVDGNCFAIMGYVSKAMRECGYSEKEINAYIDKAKAGNYNHLVATSITQINMLNSRK